MDHLIQLEVHHAQPFELIQQKNIIIRNFVVLPNQIQKLANTFFAPVPAYLEPLETADGLLLPKDPLVGESLRPDEALLDCVVVTGRQLLPQFQEFPVQPRPLTLDDLHVLNRDLLRLPHPLLVQSHFRDALFEFHFFLEVVQCTFNELLVRVGHIRVCG